MEKPRIRVPAISVADGLINMVSRLGTGADKSSHYRYVTNWVDQTQVDAAYRTSVFKKAVDIPAADMVREWRSYKGADEQQITDIDAEEMRLDLRRKVREALILARKDGNSVILIGGGGNAATELRPERIGRGGLQYINVLSKQDIAPQSRDNDPASPRFNQPRFWTLKNQGQTEVHPSRVIKFTGNPVREAYTWDGWGGESLFAVMARAITNNDQIAGAIAAMVDEAKIDVIKLKNLMANLATQDGENLLVRRFTAVNTLKSIVNAMIIDGDDEHTTKTLNFAGLTDIQNTAMIIVAGLADIPVTRMWGRSAAGLNSTGEADLRNYYDGIRAGQTIDLGPTIAPLDEMLIRSALGDRPEEIFYEWNALYQLSEKEAAEVENIFADATTKLVATGLVPDEAMSEMVKGGMIERGQWPGAEKAFDDAGDPNEDDPTPEEIAAEEARAAAEAEAVSLRAANDGRFAQDAAPRTLYVRRDVINRADIVRWAESQGFTDIVPDLHVTIAYSRNPVDWFSVGTSWSDKIEISAGGPRQMDRLGQAGEYHALLITANELVWRNKEIRENGASWDWPDYQPHISIQIGGDVPEGIEPYQGKIVLGPEIFEEVKP